jgi:hypothetical protein
VYATGRISGTIDFDPGEDTRLRRTSGLGDIDAATFVWKLTSSGKFSYATIIDAAEEFEDYGTGVFVDRAGDAYITGTAATGTENNFPRRVFAARMSAKGKPLWNTDLGGGFSHTLALDPQQRPVFYSRGPDPARSAILTKVNVRGRAVWQHPVAQGEGEMFPGGIAVSADGDIVINGGFHGSYDFDFRRDRQITLTAQTGSLATDAFLARYTGGGAPVFARRFAIGNGYAGATDIGFSAGGHIFSTGIFSAQADMDGAGEFILSTHNPQMNASAPPDVFMVEHDANGKLVFARSIGNSKRREDTAFIFLDNFARPSVFLQSTSFLLPGELNDRPTLRYYTLRH